MYIISFEYPKLNKAIFLYRSEYSFSGGGILSLKNLIYRNRQKKHAFTSYTSVSNKHPWIWDLKNIIPSIITAYLVSVHALLDDSQYNYVFIWYRYFDFDYPIFTAYGNYRKRIILKR